MPVLRLAILCAALVALPASAQTPAVTPAGAAEALAWRALQACVAISKGASLETAAPRPDSSRTTPAGPPRSPNAP
jgi:hypothetical protein